MEQMQGSSLNKNDLYPAQHRAEVASALCFRFAGSKDVPQLPMNQINPPLLFLLQMLLRSRDI